MTTQELLQEMERLVEGGDAQAFDAFATEHFTEFPKDVQGKLLLSFYTETLEGEAAIADVQRQGVEALKELEAIQAEASRGQ